MRNILNKKITFKLSQLIVFVFVVVIGFIYFSGYVSLKEVRSLLGPNTADFKASEEIEKIKSTDNMDEQVGYYLALMERAGPVEAQEQLFKSGLPFTGQTHLLNHTAGDYLYDKYGYEGLAKCKIYFLASCFHGFLIRTISAEGLPGVSKAMEECRKSGPAVFPQCAHAVGHGFLAYAGYKNLTEALKSCDQVRLSSEQFPIFNCYDGVFMENIWAVHEDGTPSSDRWIREDDPFYPCDSKRIDKKYHLGCWSNQPSLMYQLFQGDIARVGRECDRVTDSKNKEMCFNGLARQIHPNTKNSLDSIFDMCGLLPADWIDYCVNINASSFFSVGDRELPFSICSRVVGQKNKTECYQSLIWQIRNSGEEIGKLCEKIDDAIWKKSCLKDPLL